MRMLVTGGAGFIGAHVCAALARAGHEVLVVDNLSSGRVEQLPAGVRCIATDILAADLSATFSDFAPEVVVHLAAQISVSQSLEFPMHDLRTNLLGTVNVLEAAHKAGARRVVFSSSAAVYGAPAELPVREGTAKEPMSPYGLSKLTGEDYVRMLCAKFGLSHAVLRFGNVYGPLQVPEGEAGVVAIFCRCALEGRSPVINGDGLQTRDFIYVGDVAEAVRLAAEAEQRVATWNVGSGRPISVTELWNQIRRAAQAVGLRFDTGAAPQYGPGRPGDIRDSYLDISRIAAELGWAAKTDLPSGLQTTLRWALENLSGKVV